MIGKDRLHHETIMQTGITCKKIPFYIGNSACRCCTVENVNILRSYVSHF